MGWDSFQANVESSSCGRSFSLALLQRFILQFPYSIPLLLSYWHSCCHVLNSFLCALSFWLNQAKPALEDFASTGLLMQEPSNIKL